MWAVQLNEYYVLESNYKKNSYDESPTFQIVLLKVISRQSQ